MSIESPSPESSEGNGIGRHARRGRMMGGAILLVLGSMLLLRNFYPWFRFEDYWPVILVVIGCVMIWRSGSR